MDRTDKVILRGYIKTANDDRNETDTAIALGYLMGYAVGRQSVTNEEHALIVSAYIAFISCDRASYAIVMSKLYSIVNG